MLLYDLIPDSVLAQDAAEGFVAERAHPQFPQLRILNYTPRAQYAKHWTAATLASRGLIYNADTMEVLARPFRKFFNYAEHDSGDFDLDAPILGAFDKADGSLGIAYRLPDGRIGIATRGSFTSEQAVHATARAADVEPLLREGKTALFEIVYPDNRIVLDYGERDELIPLGWVDNETGAYEPPMDAPSFGATLREALSLPPRPNAEGLVVWVDAFKAVKIKQSDYLEIHRAVFGLSAKEVWRQLCAGTFDAFATNLPDEFQDGARAVAAELTERFDRAFRRADGFAQALRAQDMPTQKDKAMWVQKHVPLPERNRVFALERGSDISAGIWRELEPKGAGMAL